MFRIIVIVTCLLIIGDYTLRLRRWYLQHRRLRCWQSRIEHLDPSEPAVPMRGRPPSDVNSHPKQAGFNWLGAIFMAIVLGGVFLALWLVQHQNR